VSRIGGVKRERVRWESDSAASRRRFFCEKEACVSVAESSEKEGIWESSNTVFNQSTGSCGGLCRGSTGTVLSSDFSINRSSSSRYSGDHMRSESRCSIAGKSSINKLRNCFSISR
jgi:hypothetical protein